MPVTYENGEARVKPGSSKQLQADKLANEMKKIGQALKQRGIDTALTNPKMAQEFSSYEPKLHAPKLKLNLAGRNINGTKKEVPPPPVDAPEPPPKNLVEKLDRFLLPELETTGLQIPEPRPWFGVGSATPDASTLGGRLTATAGSRAPEAGAPREGAAEGESGPGTRGAGAAGQEERHRRPPHLTLVFPLDLSQFVPPEGMGPSGLAGDMPGQPGSGTDAEAVVDNAAAAAAAQQQAMVEAQHHRQQLLQPAAEAAAALDPAASDSLTTPSSKRKQVQILTEAGA